MTHKWTFMVYMAGDNGRVFDDGRKLMPNLEGYGWDDVREMSRVGSTTEVAVVAQFDTLDANETPRLFIDGSSETGTVVDRVPPVNTGDPKNLTDFMTWAMNAYPAERYALILWNHGTGWKEDDIYARYREAQETSRRDQVRSIRSRKRLLNRAFFLPTAAEIMQVEDDETRAICYDDSSMDFLDNRDLVNAIRDAGFGPDRRLSVLGMDACLMSMVEVAYQVREYADYMVGSQEIEQGTGWPYDKILEPLVATPEMSPLDLSKLIVSGFGEHYMGMGRGGGGINTQAAIDLRAIPQTFAKIQTLSGKIAEAYSDDLKTEIALSRAPRDAQSFEDEDYLDLRHLMECIRDEYGGPLDVGDLAGELVEHLTLEAPGSPIVANFHGYGRPNANGLSVYFPARRYSPFYDKQTFALSGWNKVIRKANRLQAPAITAVDERAADGAKRSVGVRQIVCPICEGQTTVPDNIGEIGDTVATKGVRDLVTQIVTAIQAALASTLDEANQWLDLPCPHCHHTFQYNVRTGDSRR